MSLCHPAHPNVLHDKPNTGLSVKRESVLCPAWFHVLLPSLSQPRPAVAAGFFPYLPQGTVYSCAAHALCKAGVKAVYEWCPLELCSTMPYTHPCSWPGIGQAQGLREKARGQQSKWKKYIGQKVLTEP